MSSTSRRQFLATSALAGLGAVLPAPVLRAEETKPAGDKPRPLVIGMVVFEGFELLDVFGPLEMFGMLRDKVTLTLLAERAGPVRSGAGPVVLADRSLSETGPLDVLMVPGGGGTRREVNNASLIEALGKISAATPHVATICTGSALLAKTGLLDGIPATTNKRAYKWATSQGPKVQWVAAARWVESGKFYSSSGVSAGMDMALGLISALFDPATAASIAQGAEYEWNSDKSWDPFAKLNGL